MISPIRAVMPTFKGVTLDRKKAEQEAIGGADDIVTFEHQGVPVHIYNGPGWQDRELDTYNNHATNLPPLQISGPEDKSHKGNQAAARLAHWMLERVEAIFFAQASGVPKRGLDGLWNTLATDYETMRNNPR